MSNLTNKDLVIATGGEGEGGEKVNLKNQGIEPRSPA